MCVMSVHCLQNIMESLVGVILFFFCPTFDVIFRATSSVHITEAI